jgi:outer membrane protein OmpA-like peptidoglycan-associated protein
VAKFSLNAPVVTPASTHKSIKAVFYFSGDSSKLSASTRAKLRAISKQLKAGAGVKVVVEGFVFKTPNTSNDRKLSYARAKNVVAYLRLLGVKAVFSSNARGIAKQHNATARRAELVATWNLPS